MVDINTQHAFVSRIRDVIGDRMTIVEVPSIEEPFFQANFSTVDTSQSPPNYDDPIIIGESPNRIRGKAIGVTGLPRCKDQNHIKDKFLQRADITANKILQTIQVNTKVHLYHEVAFAVDVNEQTLLARITVCWK